MEERPTSRLEELKHFTTKDKNILAENTDQYRLMSNSMFQIHTIVVTWSILHDMWHPPFVALASSIRQSHPYGPLRYKHRQRQVDITTRTSFSRNDRGGLAI